MKRTDLDLMTAGAGWRVVTDAPSHVTYRHSVRRPFAPIVEAGAVTDLTVYLSDRNGPGADTTTLRPIGRVTIAPPVDAIDQEEHSYTVRSVDELTAWIRARGGTPAGAQKIAGEPRHDALDALDALDDNDEPCPECGGGPHLRPNEHTCAGSYADADALGAE